MHNCHALVNELSFLCCSMKNRENWPLLSVERLGKVDMAGTDLIACLLTVPQNNSLKTVTIPLPYGDNFSWLLL